MSTNWNMTSYYRAVRLKNKNNEYRSTIVGKAEVVPGIDVDNKLGFQLLQCAYVQVKKKQKRTSFDERLAGIHFGTRLAVKYYTACRPSSNIYFRVHTITKQLLNTRSNPLAPTTPGMSKLSWTAFLSMTACGSSPNHQSWLWHSAATSPPAPTPPTRKGPRSTRSPFSTLSNSQAIFT